MLPTPSSQPDGFCGKVRRALGRGLTALISAVLLAAIAFPASAAGPDLRLVDEVLVVTRGEAAVEVFHLFTLVNEGDETATDLLLPVAEGAVRLRLARLGGGSGDEPFLERAEPGELPRDPEPLEPGQRRTYQATYRLWQSRWPLALKRPLPYPSAGVTLLARAGELEATGLQVARLGRQQAEGVELDVYRVDPAEPVDRWQVVIRPPGGQAVPILAGAQAQNPLDDLPGSLRWWLPGLVGAAVLVWLARRSAGARRPAGSRTSQEPGSLAAWSGRLAALDLSFQRGELPEEAYRRQREALLTAFKESRVLRGPKASSASVAGPPPSVDRG